MKYAVIGSTFSGNKGAASMLEASVQTISKRDKDATFVVFTIYKEQDDAFNSYDNVELISATPLQLGLLVNPLALLYKILVPLRSLIRKQRHINALVSSDVLLDQGGITFVDGREKFLIYNVATILPAMFVGTRVVKCSQAMGPFSGINKFIAKLILPRVDTICARGALTRQHLDSLGLQNVIDATDYAFLMDITKDEAKAADKILKSSGLKTSADKNIAIMPSEVVRKKAEATGQDYVAYNTEFIEYLLSEGYHVLLMAYSARGGNYARHNNDLPICRDIAQSISHNNFTFIDDELSAQQLRHLISKMDMIVTSRFHSMVAALSVVTPPLVIGWSHKYAEVMDMFGLKDSALGSNNLDQKKLREAFGKNINNLKSNKAKIKANLPDVKASATRQVDSICLGS